MPFPRERAKPFKNLVKINIVRPESAAGRDHSLTSPGTRGRSLRSTWLPSLKTCISNEMLPRGPLGGGVEPMAAKRINWINCKGSACGSVACLEHCVFPNGIGGGEGCVTCHRWDTDGPRMGRPQAHPPKRCSSLCFLLPPLLQTSPCVCGCSGPAGARIAG